MTNTEKLEQIASDVYGLIGVVKDSCERNGYFNEQVALEYAISLQNELISEIYTLPSYGKAVWDMQDS